jgi:hypothetical protein
LAFAIRHLLPAIRYLLPVSIAKTFLEDYTAEDGLQALYLHFFRNPVFDG